MLPEPSSVQDQVASLWGSDPQEARKAVLAAGEAKLRAALETHGEDFDAVAAQGKAIVDRALRDATAPELDNSGQAALRVGQRITLRIPGKPQPGGSKRAFVPKGWTRPVLTDANPKAVDWKRTVQAFALAAATGRILDGPLRVSMTFIVARPKGHFGVRGLRPSAPAYPAVMPDVLKLARPTEDALTGIVWTDDARIVEEILRKRYTTNGRTGAIVEVEEIAG